MIRLRQLIPAEVSPIADVHRLHELYTDGTDAKSPWVRVNMVSTLDGAATGGDGRSGTISSESDQTVFDVLRAWSDVVLIGGGTARAERYTRLTHELDAGPIRRPEGPALAVVSTSGHVDVDRVFAADGGPAYLLTCRSADEEAIAYFRARGGSVIRCGVDVVDLPAAVGELAARGMTRVLAEGGPHILRSLISHGLVDELDLTIGLTAAGGHAGRIVQGDGINTSFTTKTLLAADDALIGRWLVDPAG